jgi:phage portal protein BeeE
MVTERIEQVCDGRLMGLFRRKRSVEQRIQAAAQARIATNLTVEDLPIAQGLVQLHADLVSSLELVALDERTGRPVVNQPETVAQPDPREDREDTIHKMVQALWWGGNAPCSIARAAGGLTSVRVLNPNQVGYEPDPFDTTWLRHWYLDGRPMPLDAIQNWKLNDDPRRGPMGRSPFQNARQALDVYAWAYSHLLTYFAQGGNPSLVLKSARTLAPGPVPEDAAGRTEAQIAQDDWIRSRQLFAPAVLDPQWSIDAGPEPQDLEQIVRVLEYCGAQTAQLTNVPPSIANVLAASSLTYSTTADELRRWLLLQLGPTWLKRIERGFTRLLPPGLVARFDQDSLTRFDVLENAASIAAAPVAQLRAVA